MANEELESRAEVYCIPPNFEDAGGVMGGRLSERNAIEAAILCIPFTVIYLKFIFPLIRPTLGIVILIFAVAPGLFLSIFGIKGESVSQFLFAVIRFHRHKRLHSYIGFTEEDAGELKPKGILDTIAQNGYKALFQKEAGAQKSQPNNAKEKGEKNTVKHDIKSKQAKHKNQKQSSHGGIMSSALKENLLKKLELTNEDDEDY